MAQDPATLWIQSYPSKTKTSQETERSLRKFLEPSEQPKVIYTDNSLEFGKSCEDKSWNHRTSTPHKHSVYTHFPRHRDCEICKRTKITRVQCRRRNGGAVPRAVNFGDLITADHKVLSDNCESRNNHRYAVVVQDLATQWIQAYPCKIKTLLETQRSLQKFLEPDRKPKVIYTDNSLEFGKACEDLSWNRCTSTPHRSETNGIAERAARRIKEGTSAALLQCGLDEKWSAASIECCCYLRHVQDFLADRQIGRGMRSQGMSATGSGGPARVPNLRVCEHLWEGVAHAR